MFFTVKHGADEEALFNPDCSLKLLLDSIKKRCNFPHGAKTGLANEECTDIINLSEQDSERSSCTTLFSERGIYTLIAIVKRDTGPPLYKPLLDNVDPEFAQKLDSLSNPRTSKKPSWSRTKAKVSTITSFSGSSKRRQPTSLSKSFSSSHRGK